jgi:hypothetical protein
MMQHRSRRQIESEDWNCKLERCTFAREDGIADLQMTAGRLSGTVLEASLRSSRASLSLVLSTIKQV